MLHGTRAKNGIVYMLHDMRAKTGDRPNVTWYAGKDEKLLKYYTVYEQR